MSFMDDYEPVEDRLRKFWVDHPGGRIITALLSPGDRFDEFIVRAEAYRDDSGIPDASGLAHEKVGQGNVNRDSALENCETSAIGRALANLGYAAKGKRPSREEMAGSEPVDLSDMIRMKVEMFGQWDEEERRAKWVEHAGRVLGGKPQTPDEVDQVVNAMSADYYRDFPESEERPF